MKSCFDATPTIRFPGGKCRRGGIIYLHDISEDRLRGIHKHELQVLDRSLDRDQRSNLIIATTKWGRTDEQKGQLQQNHLKEAQWAGVLGAGAKLYEFKGNPGEAWEIVQSFLSSLEDGQELDIGKRLDRLQDLHQPGPSPRRSVREVLGNFLGIFSLFRSSPGRN